MLVASTIPRECNHKLNYYSNQNGTEMVADSPQQIVCSRHVQFM